MPCAAAIAAELAARGAALPFAVVSNPEFLKEGAAVDDFMRPDRVVIGSDDDEATRVMRLLYAPFQRNHERLIVMDVRSAELTKYAANAMLATRISFMNEIANLAERLGADIEQVRRGIGADPRIGFHFLYPGAGYGGSCFPKDVKAIIRTAANSGVDLHLLAAVERVNDAPEARARRQDRAAVRRRPRRPHVRDLGPRVQAEHRRHARGAEPRHRRRAARARRAGAGVRSGGDAGRQSRLRRRPADRLRRGAARRAGAGADALVIVTEWKEFRSPDFDALRARLKQPVIFDGRNLYDPAEVRRLGFEYFPIGRGSEAGKKPG